MTEMRNAHEILGDILSELRDLNARIGFMAEVIGVAGAASSIQIEDYPTKDRPVRITTKHYTGSALDVTAALDAHGYAHREAERRAMAGWASTLDAAIEVDAALRRSVGSLPRISP